MYSAVKRFLPPSFFIYLFNWSDCKDLDHQTKILHKDKAVFELHIIYYGEKAIQTYLVLREKWIATSC